MAQIGPAILADLGRLHVTAIGMCQILCAKTNAQHRHLPPEDAEVDLRCSFPVHGERAARNDKAFQPFDLSRKVVVRMDLAVYVELAHTPRNKLCVL